MRTGMVWDEWFLEMCNMVAKKSQCLSRKIGSLLVRDNSIISQGYNGPPRGIITCDERWLVDGNLRIKAGFQTDKTEVDKDEFYNKVFKPKLEGKCPRYVPELGFKSGQGLEWCVAGHSEENAILNAARNRIKTKNCKLYMSCGVPCSKCLVKIINAGIEEIIITKLEYYDVSAEYLLRQSNLKYRVYEHLRG